MRDDARSAEAGDTIDFQRLAQVGAADGRRDGAMVGVSVGSSVGVRVGAGDGSNVGGAVGTSVGTAVGYEPISKMPLNAMYVGEHLTRIRYQSVPQCAVPACHVYCSATRLLL